MSPRTEWRFVMTGWLMFAASAVFFTWSTARAADVVGVIGSVLFLAACFVFLAPVWHLRPRANAERPPERV